ncbi:MAG TPA: NUDIX domain-containing protein, partial [Candidatus Saccharimonadales bacterium]|nr:NUDIX domain-containing protein [Candidatus Saccharimonadales bacterium]
VENSKGQVLLQQRSFDLKISPGNWTPAADGTVPKDSTYDETAPRELEEEVGLKGVPLIKTNKIHAKFEFGWRQVQGYTVICDWPLEKFTIQRDEVEQIEWVDKQQLLAEISGKAPHTRVYPPSCKMWPKLFNLV